MLDKITRRDIRREGFKNLKRRYYLNIIIVFMVSFIVNGGYSFATRRYELPEDEKLISVVEEVQSGKITGPDDKISNSDILLRFIYGVFDIKGVENPDAISKTSTKYYGGVASVFVNEITGSQSFVFGILNGCNELIFKGKVSNSVIIFIFSLISIFIFLFLKNVIVVGQNRYFLEQRRYHDTGAGEILFPYKNKRLKNIAIVMFFKYIFQVLWDFTIVGGVIKYYEYMLIPYIIAENPAIKRKEAFLISKKLMHGNKYRAFLIDFSLIPWYILSALTFNLTGLFFSDAYVECVKAEMYMRIRNERRDSLPLELRELLNDDMLAIEHIEETEHPSGEEVLDIPTIDFHNFKYDYMRSYPFLSAVQLFFTYAFAGYIWEVFFYLATTGEFVNRGTMHGPWLPIYGCGGILIIYLLKPLRKKPAALFAGTVVVCGTVEYTTSWLLEKMFNSKWWDYTGYFMNLNGRICLEGLLVFGMAGLLFTYVLSPMLDDIYGKIDKKYRKIVCAILLILFILDIIWSVMVPNTGEGITSGLV
ncbi:MAG: DUF975 family protein [Eubacterium sp.]|nr:DUF975 family protein [Eubacterium sp.]